MEFKFKSLVPCATRYYGRFAVLDVIFVHVVKFITVAPLHVVIDNFTPELVASDFEVSLLTFVFGFLELFF